MTARIAGHLNASTPERNLALTIDDTGRITMLPPDEVCRRLNNLLLNEIETDNYLTMVLADVDLGSGKAIMAQAGHPSPAVQRADGTVEFVSSYSMPIGLIPDAEYSSFTIELAPGDRLLFYSDGITECPSRGADMLGEEGLIEILQAGAQIRGPDLMKQLMTELSEYSGFSGFSRRSVWCLDRARNLKTGLHIPKKHPVTIVLDKRDCVREVRPDRCMAYFVRRTQANRRSRQIDLADFLGPKIVFRHEREPSERAQPTQPVDLPSGFFPNFTMKCGNWVFAGVYTTTWKLKFRLGLHLVG